MEKELMEKELKKIKKELAKLKTRVFNLEYKAICNEQELNNLEKLLEKKLEIIYALMNNARKLSEKRKTVEA